MLELLQGRFSDNVMQIITVSNRESRDGKLNLRQRSLDVLSEVAELSREQARRKLQNR